MKSVNYSELHQNLASYLNEVEDDCITLIVYRSAGKKVVVMNFDDYQTNGATLHLMSNSSKATIHLEN